MALHTILGAGGAIGSLLANELAAHLHQIRLVSRHPKKVNDTDELFAADLTDAEQVENAIKGSEVVYLVVGLAYKLTIWQQQWPGLMQAVIYSCKKHDAKLVFFDNMYLYSKDSVGHMTEDSAIDPPSKKGKVREEIAAMLMHEVKAGNLTALIARAPDFYGPDCKTSFLNETVYQNLKKGKRPNWLMDAGKKHSFIFTPDAAKATALLGNTPDAFNQVWHLPTAKNPPTGSEMIDLFNAEMNTSKKPLVLSKFFMRLLGLFVPIMRELPEMMYQYDRDYIFDSSKFEQHFQFIPTPYREGVRKVVKESTGA